MNKKQHLAILEENILYQYEHLRGISSRHGNSHYYDECYQNAESFPYVPSRIDHLEECSRIIRRHFRSASTPLSVMDIGCGDGLFLTYLYFLMKLHGREINMSGIEINEKLQSFLPINSRLHMDFFDIKTSHLRDFKVNVIYMYCPLRNSIKMTKFLKILEAHIKAETLVIFTDAVLSSTGLKELGYTHSEGKYQTGTGVFYKMIR